MESKRGQLNDAGKQLIADALVVYAAEMRKLASIPHIGLALQRSFEMRCENAEDMATLVAKSSQILIVAPK